MEDISVELMLIDDGSLFVPKVGQMVSGHCLADLGLFDESRHGFSYEHDSEVAANMLIVALEKAGFETVDDRELLSAVGAVCTPNGVLDGWPKFTLRRVVNEEPAKDEPNILSEERWEAFVKADKPLYRDFLGGLHAYSDVMDRSQSEPLAQLWDMAWGQMEVAEPDWESWSPQRRNAQCASRVARAWLCLVAGPEALLK